MQTRQTTKAMAYALYRTVKLFTFLCCFAFISLSLPRNSEPTVLERVLTEGKITMISRNGPTTYFEGPEGFAGFEYELAAAFADYLGVRLEVVEEEDLGMMLHSIGSNIGDFAGAGLSVTEQRKQFVAFSPSYMEIKQQLLYQAGTSRPKTIEDLYDKQIVVIGNSSHEENLRKLKQSYPRLRWGIRHDLEMMELIEMVHAGEIDFTIVDSNAYDINSLLYPRARVAFDISEPEQLAWAFPLQKDASLLHKAEAFFKHIEKSDLIETATETYYGHVGELDFGGSLVFTNRLVSRLPKWKDKLKDAADETDLDWQLLAALSYQESHWNPRAVSHTGVKGFMMLTRTTSKEVGVTNRLNADQSIMGGARYFKRIYDRIPERISTPDRTWLALAAYNIGFGHLEDARVLTEHLGGNPDKWVEVKDNLLLLAKRKYYKFTKHGYARGWEAVDYVQNIRNFYNIIAWHEKSLYQQQLASLDQQSHYEEFSSVVTDAVRDLSTPSVEL